MIQQVIISFFPRKKLFFQLARALDILFSQPETLEGIPVFLGLLFQQWSDSQRELQQALLDIPAKPVTVSVEAMARTWLLGAVGEKAVGGKMWQQEACASALRRWQLMDSANVQTSWKRAHAGGD